MKKLRYRIRAAWEILFGDDLILVRFANKFKICQVISISDSDIVDELANQIPKLADLARRIDMTKRGAAELERMKAAGEWPIKIEEPEKPIHLTEVGVWPDKAEE